MNLLENGEIVNDDMRIAEVSNEYFANITNELDLTENEANLLASLNTEDIIDNTAQNDKNHPSIKQIKHQWARHQPFEFR